MDRLPLFVDLRDRPVVIIGGGEVAARKLRLLRSAGARVTVVAPALCDALAGEAARNEFRHVAARFEAAHLDGARLVVAATGDAAVNAAVAAAAEARNVWINAVDDLAASSAILPGIIDRSPVIVAVSTGGASPVLARRLRERIEAALDHTVAPLARLLADWRARLITRWPDAAARRRAVDALLDGPLDSALRRARPELADAIVRDAIAADPQAPAEAALVTLVGAGPGDAGLLTLKGLRALQRADVVLHDRLVSADVLALARRDADLIEVGKTGGGPSTPQERIHELLLEHARSGRRVVRLKGGDPFVFGRGGEEIDALRTAGIAFEVVPGITTAVALAQAGIPLTHRGVAAGARLVTAQRAADGRAPEWQSWAESRDTLVVYMGTTALETLRSELLRHGMPAQTPIALVERLSLPEQRVVLGTLEAAPRLAALHRIESPSVVVIGAVTELAAQMHWFGQPPIRPSTPAEHAA